MGGASGGGQKGPVPIGSVTNFIKDPRQILVCGKFLTRTMDDLVTYCGCAAHLWRSFSRGVGL